MSSKLRIAIAVALLFGSASTVLAASNGRAAQRAQRIERVAPPALFEGRDAAPLLSSSQLWGGCATDDGQGRFRPCDEAGGG
jgi:hypothetical protein